MRKLRGMMNTTNYDTEISRVDFECYFQKTKEKVRFTFGGWDGKSYDGESRTATVYRACVKGYENVRFIKAGKGLHSITEDSLMLEKATGESHPGTIWFVNVGK